MLHAVRMEDVVHNRTILVGILRPIHVRPVSLRVLLELLKQQVQMAVAVHLYGAGHVAQAFPFGKLAAHIVALGPHHPQGLVVPPHLFLVFQELFGIS